ncbi:hypothetical protein Tco_1328181 [Tanacetum coccineum]
MENANPSSPPESPNSFRDRTILEINALLESLNLTVPPLDRELSHLVGDVEFVELLKKYKIKDSSYDELEEKDQVVEVDELGVGRCPIIVGGNPSNLKYHAT